MRLLSVGELNILKSIRNMKGIPWTNRLLMLRKWFLDVSGLALARAALGKNRLEQRREILLRNRELALLYELGAQVRTVSEFRAMLEKFIRKAVEGLQLHSAVIQMDIIGETLDLPYKIVECPCDRCARLQGKDCYCSIVSIYYHVFPIGPADSRIGQLAICSYLPLNEQTLRIMESLAGQIAVTAENLRLWHELKQKEELRLKLLAKVIQAQEEERKRIARELHDETSQSLTSLLLGLSILADKKTEEDRSTQIRQLRTMVQETLEEVHDLAWQLRPSVLDKYGLSKALERYLEEYRAKYPLDVDLCILGLEGRRLQSEIEISVYRMIQEALTNVARYAKAKNVSVIVNKKNGILSVIIEDDGVGFDVEHVLERDPTKHNLGLRGMQERAILLNGVLRIESGIGSGTTLFMNVPLEEEEPYASGACAVGG